MASEQPSMSDPQALIRLFHPDPADLGVFAPISASDVPPPYRELLDHDAHMTVTIERFHSALVDVDVLAHQVTDGHYAREILLRRQTDHAVVQYGIMRIDLGCVSADVRQEIEVRREPLGRILIRHDILRQVELLALWRITPGPNLVSLFGITKHETVFGRTALIHFDNRPAVELLEIVTPA
jgi:chorismate-pyruvate lyase